MKRLSDVKKETSTRFPNRERSSELFVGFLAGGLAGGLPTLLSIIFPNFSNKALLISFIGGWLLILFYVKTTFKKKTFLAMAALLIAIMFWIKLPKPVPMLQITSPRSGEIVECESGSSTSEVKIIGKIPDEIWPQIHSQHLQVYVFKIDKQEQIDFNSQAQAKIDHQERNWSTTLGFYCDEPFKIFALAGRSAQIAAELAREPQVYLSNTVKFETSSNEKKH